MRQDRKRVEITLVADELAKAVSDYLSEMDNPAPDYTMRRVYRSAMETAQLAYHRVRYPEPRRTT